MSGRFDPAFDVDYVNGVFPPAYDTIGVLPPLGPELRGNFVIGKTGSAADATYNTSTGVGSVTRVNVSNLSFVELTSPLPGESYQCSIENSGSGNLSIRTNSGTTVITTISPGDTELFTVDISGSGGIRIQGATGTQTFIINSVKQIL